MARRKRIFQDQTCLMHESSVGRRSLPRRLSLEQEIVGSNPTSPATLNSNISQICIYVIVIISMPGCP